MAERIVINTGPLITLARIEALHIPEQLPFEFVCPEQVREELDAGEQAQFDWVVRGEVPGAYTLGATVLADIVAFGIPVAGGALTVVADSPPFFVEGARLRCEVISPGAVDPMTH